jgi:hypothetical protein
MCARPAWPLAYGVGGDPGESFLSAKDAKDAKKNDLQKVICKIKPLWERTLSAISFAVSLVSRTESAFTKHAASH